MQQYRVSTPFLAVSPNEGTRFVTLTDLPLSHW